MKSKVVDISEAIKQIQDGMTIMVGGFLSHGTPEHIIDAVVAKGVKDLTVICNDTAYEDRGVGKWIVNKMVKKAIVSHIGTNPETGRQMFAKELEVELSPQGTLAERIRAGGCGLGGVLTPTGLGTAVANGKASLTIDKVNFLFELPLKADVAIIGATIADESGNLIYKGSTRNFNPLMAMAADVVIAGAETIVKTGELDPDYIMTPNILVDYIVGGGN